MGQKVNECMRISSASTKAPRIVYVFLCRDVLSSAPKGAMNLEVSNVLGQKVKEVIGIPSATMKAPMFVEVF